MDRAAIIKAVVELRKAVTPPDTPPTSELMMFMQFMRQEKLDTEQRLKQEKLENDQRIKQEKLETEQRLKQEKAEAEQRLLDIEQRLKQEKLETEQRLKQEKLEIDQRIKQEKLEAEQRLLEAEQRLKQEKLEAEQRLLVAEQRLKDERQEAENRHAALLMAFKEDSKIKLDSNKDALEASSREEHALQKKREAKEQEYGARLLKAKTLMKDLLTDMPEEPADIPAYFVNVSRAFTQNKIDDDLQVTILRPRLTRESIRLLDGSPPTDIKTFEQIRNLILRIYKLSPGKYKEFFKSAEKKTSETWTQFANRLSILWGYYLDSREINHNYERLVNLMLCDRLKDSITAVYLRDQIRIVESGRSKDIFVVAEHLDNYVSERADYSYNTPNSYGQGKKWHKSNQSSGAQGGSQTHDTQGGGGDPKGAPAGNGRKPDHAKQSEVSTRGDPKKDDKNYAPSGYGNKKGFEGKGENKNNFQPPRNSNPGHRNSYPPCQHCGMSTHASHACWDLPGNAHLRRSKGPGAPHSGNVRRVMITNRHEPGSKNCPQVKEQNLDSVNNLSSGFARADQCVNAESFDISALFEIPSAELRVARCLVDSDRKQVGITDSIPASCKITVNFGDGDIPAIVDSGADVTVLQRKYLPAGDAVQARGTKIHLSSAFNETVEAELVTVLCRIGSTEGINYPATSLQVAVTDKLAQACLVSLSDFKKLSEMTLVAIPGRGVLSSASNSWSPPAELSLSEAVETLGLGGSGHSPTAGELESGGKASPSLIWSEPLRRDHTRLERGESSPIVTDSQRSIGDSGGRLSGGIDPEGATLLPGTTRCAGALTSAVHAGSRDGREVNSTAAEVVTEQSVDITAVASLVPEGNMAKSQRGDASLRDWYDLLQSPNSNFFLDGDLLYRRRTEKGYQGEAKLVLPEVCRIPVMKLAHELGHYGARKTWLRLKGLFDWPKMKVEIYEYCRACADCQRQRRVTVLDRIPIKGVIRPDVAFDTVSIDCAGPIEPPSSRGHHYVLVMVDHCTRWCECVPLKTLTAKETCNALNTIFQRIGIPRVVISDNGTNFVSNLNKIFFSKFGIEIRNSTPLHPEGNSLAERLVQNVKKMLHHVIISNKPREWDLKIPYLMWALRTMENESTGFSPYELVYGRASRGPLEILRDTWGGDKSPEKGLGKTSLEYLEQLRLDLSTYNDVAATNVANAQRAYTEQYNVRSRDKSFEVGDQVLVLLPDSTNKLRSSWQGPGIIHFKLSENSYAIAMPEGVVRHLHANHLREFKVQVKGVGIIFEDEADRFGEVECCETGIDATILTTSKLNQVEMSHLTDSQQLQLRAVLWEYRTVFNDKPGECAGVSHEIKLIEGFKPKFHRPYRIPDILKTEVDKQIDELLKNGKIRPSNSPFAHPIVLVSKPDNSVRICIDFRYVNAGTINDGYPMVRSDDLLRKIAPARYITTLDCTSGYYQIPMETGSIPLTAFITHRGHFECITMPFGLRCASQTFQRTIDKMLMGHQEYAAGYIDDISVYSGDWPSHIQHLKNVLEEFKLSGMTLKLKKCFFARQKVQFLGHLVGGGVITPIQGKLDAIQRLPEPTTKKLLRSFLGMCNYYRSFIASFSEIALPLTKLTQGGKVARIHFSTEERHAFNALKEALMSSSVLGTPRYDRPFQIQCDASAYAVGCCLSQLDDDARERPIAFSSTKLSDTQTRWSTLEKEAYAVVFSFKQFDHIIFGSHVDVYTDHDPLQYMIDNSPKCSKLTRWALFLSRYDITIHHKAGVLNENADCLSRLV